MSEYRNLAKNTVIFAVGQFSVKFIQFFLMPLLTVALTTEAYGSAEALASLVELIIPLFTLGLQDAVFRFCMRKEIDNKTVLSSTLAVVTAGLIVIAGGALVAMNWVGLMQSIMFIVLYICYALTNIFGQYIRGSGYIKTYAAGGIVQALLLAGSAAVFVYWLRLGAFGYLLSMSIAYFAFITMTFFIGKIYKSISFKAIDKAVLRDMLKYALPLIPNAVCWWFIQVVNRYVIIGFAGEAAAGLYVSSSKIATIINIFGTIFLQAWTISTVNSLDDEKKGEFNTRVFKAFSIFIQAATFGLLLLLPFVSMFLLQGEFYQAWRYSSIAIFTAVMSCYGSFFGAFYGANMKTKVVFISTLVGALVNTAACFLLVWLLNIEGALFASLAGYVVLAVIRIVTTQKYSLIKVNWFKEIVVLTLLFADAFMILYSKHVPTVWYWCGQAVAICLFIIISFKDIKIFFDSLIKFCKRFLGKKRTVEATDGGAGENAEPAIAEQAAAEQVEDGNADTVEEVPTQEERVND